MNHKNEEFIEFILKCGALKIGNFTLKSGRKSPYFFNSGQFDSGLAISKLLQFYAEKLNSSYELTPDDVIFGPAYKGIPLAVGCAVQLHNLFGINVGYAFDRKAEKIHGEGTGIATRWCGKTLKENNRLFMIDDVISTAQTKIDSLNLIKELFGKVKIGALLIALDREEITSSDMSACQVFENISAVPVLPVIKMSEVFLHLKSKNLITPEQTNSFLDYFNEYGTKELKEKTLV
ncbi:orotate phosphoribosyltransferase [bacterium]|nr:orotate phosphoribosyltransferase [bacterium]